jgi:hypothetical protein
MKHLLAYVAALLAFGVASAALWFGRTELAHSIPLLAFVGGFYLLSFVLAIPAQMTDAREQCAAIWQAYKSNGGPAGGAP